MDLIFETRIGRGAFAHVWRATDALGRDVAVKFFTDPTPSQVEQQALLHARALARVDHRAVVRVLAVEPQPHPETGTICTAIVMEYVPGVSLSLSNERFSCESAARIIRDLTGGLDAIHAAGLVHGDLHDANLIIHKRGATILDILYTHSLAEVGTRTARRTLAEDLRDFAKLCRQVCERTDRDRNGIAEVFYIADLGASASEVSEPFLKLLSSSAPPADDAPAERQAPLREPVPASPQPSRSAASALALLRRVNEQKESLSTVATAILEFALELGDERLIRLCEHELTGYPAPTEEETQREPDEDAAHRVVSSHVGDGVAVNPDFFVSSQQAISYMERHPNQFYRERIMYSQALPTLERLMTERPQQALVAMATPSRRQGADTEGPPVMAYAPGDTFHSIVAGLRVRLAVHLLRIVRER